MKQSKPTVYIQLLLIPRKLFTLPRVYTEKGTEIFEIIYKDNILY